MHAWMLTFVGTTEIYRVSREYISVVGTQFGIMHDIVLINITLAGIGKKFRSSKALDHNDHANMVISKPGTGIIGWHNDYSNHPTIISHSIFYSSTIKTQREGTKRIWSAMARINKTQCISVSST